jgi:hypothetical protein
MRLLNRIRDELKHHSATENQPEITIAPVSGLSARLTVLGVFALGVLMIPIAVALPLLPTWPFAALCIVCLARISTRFRVALMHNNIFRTIMSIIRTRPERMFRWTDTLMRRALGEHTPDALSG